ncbi:protein FAR1-RELATED SEQUENCE 5-like [Arachis ipaensis]|uniref:protein FAR1-RELATED SEQUENCE 5-like n=1 Tax=Arachis ipaensis TaxID=130454 RepID=UPI0007AF579A|nr:protein FAR1-RELATED SEQUENCE 5-like [Arachis ipaensis]
MDYYQKLSRNAPIYGVKGKVCGINGSTKGLIMCNNSIVAAADLYANRRKWVPIFFKSEFWAGMRSTQHSESMHAFYGGYLHCKSVLVQFVHEYDNVLGTKEQKELEDDAADSKGVIPCIGSTGIERQFQLEYTSMDKQKFFWGKPVYHTFRVDFDPLSQKGQCECNKFESAGILCCHTLAVWSYYRVDVVPSCYVLPRWNKNVIRKHTYVKSSHDVARSDESNNLFRHLCSEFYNVAQEFVACDEEAAILRAALWDAKSKLIDYRASMRSNTTAASQNTVPTQSTCGAVVHDIQGPSRVKTKGRPKGKRLGAELDKSIKKSMQKRNRKSHPDEVHLPSNNDHHGSLNKRCEDSTMWNSSEGGGFMHLLNSFRHI